MKCNICGLVCLESVECREQVESFYASSEYRSMPTIQVLSPEEHFNDHVLSQDVRKRLEFIASEIEIAGARILEVGSASGRLLETLGRLGARKVVGVELDQTFSSFAERRGLRILTRPIEELELQDEFDLVVIFHTLEHVFSPMSTIRAIYRALARGGCFLGEVPNQRDWRIEIFNDEIAKRFHFDPAHRHYFDSESLGNYLQRCGFEGSRFETIERYDSLAQLRNILGKREPGVSVEDVLRKHIFPKDDADEMRLQNPRDPVAARFNALFSKAVNSELMGNCLRWVAWKN